MDVSDIFLFSFRSGAGERKEGSEDVAGGSGGRGNLCREGRGGLGGGKFFFGGGCRNSRQDLLPLKVGLRWAFVNGLKLVQKWVKSGFLGCKSG